MTDQARDVAHVQTYRDADAAFSMAKALWKAVGMNPTPEAFQATVATLMIHTKDVRRFLQSPPPSQAGQTRAAGPARPAPAPAKPRMACPACPACGGEMWDNRGKKKNPKGPDFRCKDKNCIDDQGRQNGFWEKDFDKQATTVYAAAHAEKPAPDFNEFPEQLNEEDDLPFEGGR